MNKAEQRAAAKELYLLGWEQGRIATTVDVSTATMSAWVNKEGWKGERAKKYSLEDSISNQVLDLIDYQLAAIRSGMEHMKREKEELEAKEGKPLPLPLIGKGEIDALSKLFASVKQKDIQWTHYVNVCKELADYVSSKDPEFAKALIDFTDAFLMKKRENLS